MKSQKNEKGTGDMKVNLCLGIAQCQQEANKTSSSALVDLGSPVIYACAQYKAVDQSKLGRLKPWLNLG